MREHIPYLIDRIGTATYRCGGCVWDAEPCATCKESTRKANGHRPEIKE